jgi:inorganic pyrophosphatase
MTNLFKLPIGDKSPEIVNAIVEIPKDTNAKYEYDINLGVLRLDRCLISSMRYPASYGFIPSTISDDGDPLDILIYNTVPINSLTLVEVIVLGALHTIDGGVDDYKILGVPTYNPHNYKDITDLDSTFLDVCSDFFKHYKNNDKKKANVKVRNWIKKKSTHQLITQKWTPQD